MSFTKKHVFWLLIGLLALDGLVLLGCILPGKLGYVGSESFEWGCLAAIVIARPIGIVLMIAAALAWPYSRLPGDKDD